MNHKMKNIAIATFAVLIVLLTTAGGHIALTHNSKFTKMFSNSGNNQETQQECGNSCTQTSSNTITFGSSGLTTPSPSPSPTPTSLVLFSAALSPSACLEEGATLCGFLETNTHSPVAGANITFTGFNPDTGKTYPIYFGVSTFPKDVVTSNGGYYQVQLSEQEIRDVIGSFNTITAHYAGSAAFGASDSNTLTTGDLLG